MICHCQLPTSQRTADHPPSLCYHNIPLPAFGCPCDHIPCSGPRLRLAYYFPASQHPRIPVLQQFSAPTSLQSQASLATFRVRQLRARPELCSQRCFGGNCCTGGATAGFWREWHVRPCGHAHLQGFNGSNPRTGDSTRQTIQPRAAVAAVSSQPQKGSVSGCCFPYIPQHSATFRNKAHQSVTKVISLHILAVNSRGNGV
jgi:hypothetical protein